MMLGIQSVLYANGIKVIIAESDEDPNKERENLQTMERFMVDALLSVFVVIRIWISIYVCSRRKCPWFL